MFGKDQTEDYNKAHKHTHLSSVYIVEHKVKLLRGLEGIMESHKKGVLDIFQEHIAFCHNVVLLSKSRQGVRVSGKGLVQSSLP